MSFTTALLKGVAQLLDAGGLGVYSPDAPVDDPEATAITLINLPPQPLKVVCLTDYPVAAFPGRTDTVTGLNLRLRGDDDPLTALDMADAAYRILQGFRGQLGSGDDQVHVSQIFWHSAASLGPAAGSEHQRSVNYYVQADQATNL